MEQLTKNQAVATSQEAVQNQNEPQLRDENAHNDKSVHGVLNPTYQAGLRRDAVQPDIEAERKKRDEIEAGKRVRFSRNAEIGRRFSRNAETDLVCRLLLEKKKNRNYESQCFAHHLYRPHAEGPNHRKRKPLPRHLRQGLAIVLCRPRRTTGKLII